MGWPHVDAFKRRLAEYQARTDKTQAEVASELETTYGTLMFWLSGSRPPKRENMQRAAALFGCSVTEFMDDPGATVAGRSTADLSEARRFVSGQMFKDITADDLSDEDAMVLYEDFLAARARLVAMKQRVKAAANIEMKVIRKGSK